MARRDAQEVAALQHRSLCYAAGDPKRAATMLADACRGLLRTRDMPIDKTWSRRVLRDLPAANEEPDGPPGQ
jgi:hypothetical protein